MAVSVGTGKYYEAIFKDIVTRHRIKVGRDRGSTEPVRELKFRSLSLNECRSILFDISRSQPYPSIHFIKNPRSIDRWLSIDSLLSKVLDAGTGNKVGRLILDQSLLPGNEIDIITELRQKYNVEAKICKSHAVPGLQIADIVVGSLRVYFDTSHKTSIEPVISLINPSCPLENIIKVRPQALGIVTPDTAGSSRATAFDS